MEKISVKVPEEIDGKTVYKETDKRLITNTFYYDTKNGEEPPRFETNIESKLIEASELGQIIFSLFSSVFDDLDSVKIGLNGSGPNKEGSIFNDYTLENSIKPGELYYDLVFRYRDNVSNDRRAIVSGSNKSEDDSRALYNSINTATGKTSRTTISLTKIGESLLGDFLLSRTQFMNLDQDSEKIDYAKETNKGLSNFKPRFNAESFKPNWNARLVSYAAPNSSPIPGEFMVEVVGFPLETFIYKYYGYKFKNSKTNAISMYDYEVIVKRYLLNGNNGGDMMLEISRIDCDFMNKLENKYSPNRYQNPFSTTDMGGVVYHG